MFFADKPLVNRQEEISAESAAQTTKQMGCFSA